MSAAWRHDSRHSAPAWLSGATKAIVDFCLPETCAGCGRRIEDSGPLCSRCERAIPPVAAPLCVRCLARGGEPYDCRRHRAHIAWAAWVYDERAAVIVRALKFEGRPRLAEPLGQRIARALPPGYRPDVVIEVPLHRSRRRERGFDQAGLLAMSVARVLGAPHVSALRRTRATRGQTRLSGVARRDDVAGAFVLRDDHAWRGRRVLVIDDVLTTGATLDAALAPLHAAGAETTSAVLAWAS